MDPVFLPVKPRGEPGEFLDSAQVEPLARTRPPPPVSTQPPRDKPNDFPATMAYSHGLPQIAAEQVAREWSDVPWPRQRGFSRTEDPFGETPALLLTVRFKGG